MPYCRRNGSAFFRLTGRAAVFAFATAVCSFAARRRDKIPFCPIPVDVSQTCLHVPFCSKWWHCSFVRTVFRCKQHSRFVRTVFRRLWHMHPFVSAFCATATPFLGREGDRSAPKATGLRMSAEFRWNDRLSAEKAIALATKRRPGSRIAFGATGKRLRP